MEQHIRGTWRSRPKSRSNNGATREMSLNNLTLKVLIKEIRATHRPETQRIVHLRFTELVEVLTEVKQLHDVARLE